MIAMCCQLPSTTTSATITSADANPSPSATHARSSNQLGATRNHYHDGGRTADPNYGALPVVRPPRTRRRRCVRGSWWLLLLPARGRCQGGAPDWTNDLDAGEDRRKIGPAREPPVLAQLTGVTSCVLTGQPL